MQLDTASIPKLNTWLPSAEDFLPIIAGPCSAETEDQVLATARLLAQDKRISAFRAGVWKPRTRPGSFEGIGAASLPWLQRVQSEIGLPVAIEIAKASHVDLALKAGISILWVGARTTVNPFQVQEIAEALQGVDIPVLVKNPVNPDLQLWVGAIERLLSCGITKIAAVHRGFNTFSKDIYRNAPEWSLPIELKRLIPTLPLLTDPSHISGNTTLLAAVSQKALDLATDGLMIETHVSPASAWSDAKQQITPAILSQLLDNLVLKAQNLGPDSEFDFSIAELRERLDELDRSILAALAQRMTLAREIAGHKHRHNATVVQLARWNNVITNLMRDGKRLGLAPEDVHKLYNLIHDISVRTQQETIATLSKEVKETPIIL